MDSAVPNDNNRPVFYRRDIMFTKIVVDIIEIDGLRYTIYFVGTNTGHVYKIVEWFSGAAGSMQQLQQDGATGANLGSAGQMPAGFGFDPQMSSTWSASSSSSSSSGIQSTLVEVIEATVPEPVRAMEISQRHKSLYVGSDTQVKQINLLNCKQRHDSCMQCARDPYCGWDRKHLECRHFSSME